MAAQFTVAEILAATGGSRVAGLFHEAFSGVSTDSRTCQTGDLFIPLKGERHDGHQFLPKVLHRGVRGVLVEQDWLRRHGKPLPEATVVAVHDTLKGLGDLARAWRLRFAVPLVAITGSCGKTTTKEMIARVLSRSRRVLKNSLNLNNLIGLPLTLFGLDATHEAAVVEMGMNRFGEIRRLTQICRPTVGVLTNVHPAHTEGVGDVEGVARAKGELLECLDRDEVLVYNADDPRLAALARDFSGPSLGFGLGPRANVRASDRRVQGSGQSASLEYQGRTWPLTLKVPGEHQLLNALAASAVGLVLGVPPEESAQVLADFQAMPRRSQITTLPLGVHLFNDCYNANPGSMATALRTLVELKGTGHAAAALADMLELGSSSEAEHRELGRLAARTGVDFLVVYGPHAPVVAAGAREGGLGRGAVHPVATRRQGAQILKEYLQPGDWLLVKGSRSMHMEGLIEALEG